MKIYIAKCWKKIKMQIQKKVIYFILQVTHGIGTPRIRNIQLFLKYKTWKLFFMLHLGFGVWSNGFRIVNQFLGGLFYWESRLRKKREIRKEDSRNTVLLNVTECKRRAKSYSIEDENLEIGGNWCRRKLHFLHEN